MTFNYSPISTNKVESALYRKRGINSEIFLIFVEEVLLPRLKSRHIVIIHNVKFHLQEFELHLKILATVILLVALDTVAISDDFIGLM